MNIQITLDSEQTAALGDLLADYNAASDNSPLTEVAYLQTVLIGLINDRVEKNFNQVASSLVQAAKSASYEKRTALIAMVQTELNL